MELISGCIFRKILPSLMLLLVNAVPVFAQDEVSFPSSSLVAEISRLEKLSLEPGERHKAFLDLARLHRLSGNSDSALKCLDGALAAVPGDGLSHLERGRLLISMGEFEKAAESAAVLLSKSNEKKFFLEGRYMLAQIEAFRSGNIRLLTDLAEDKDFSDYRSGIYYTLWKLGELPSWKARLTGEFPQSPEAKIAGAAVSQAMTPLWVLYPGRDGLSLSMPIAATQPPVAAPSTSQNTAAKTSSPVIQSRTLLQAGLFSREENAGALAARIKKAGFEAQIQKRVVNGSNFWAVIVPGGNDTNVMIRKLKDAGFESFPLANR